MVLGRKHVTRMTSIINLHKYCRVGAKSRPKCPASVDSPRILVIAAPQILRTYSLYRMPLPYSGLKQTAKESAYYLRRTFRIPLRTKLFPTLMRKWGVESDKQ